MPQRHAQDAAIFIFSCAITDVYMLPCRSTLMLSELHTPLLPPSLILLYISFAALRHHIVLHNMAAEIIDDITLRADICH